MGITEKLSEDLSLRIDLELEKLREQENLLSQLDNNVLVAHIMDQLKEHYKFHIELLSNNGKMEIFNEDPAEDGGVINRFCMVSYPIAIDYTSPAVFEIIRQASVSEIELAKEQITVFVPLSSDSVDHIDLELPYQVVRNFIDQTHVAVSDMRSIIEQHKMSIQQRLDVREDNPVTILHGNNSTQQNGMS